ncbi:hypothetical protein MERGE_001324 [Pneumocystis wakefieldiae]|uniref:Polysaccharide biosynthesis domain-containing protein n=1 Tax=Pneumocystis wakefieldiae TaxID=38082 RepID=A0A899GEB3_9ASCO|nr:hypothetical protein MERGE_001324 [Pneumocystis wakefieldiae]
MAAKPGKYHVENAEEIEKQFAVKAVEHARTVRVSVYLFSFCPRNLLEMPDGGEREHSASHQDRRGDIRAFCERVSGLRVKGGKMAEIHDGVREQGLADVDDYNFGTLLRTDSYGEYEEKTTIFGKKEVGVLAMANPCFSTHSKLHAINMGSMTGSMRHKTD